jgi:hypothetical protein
MSASHEEHWSQMLTLFNVRSCLQTLIRKLIFVCKYVYSKSQCGSSVKARTGLLSMHEHCCVHLRWKIDLKTHYSYMDAEIVEHVHVNMQSAEYRQRQ